MCVCAYFVYVFILCMKLVSAVWRVFFLENEGRGREEAHRRIVCQFINLICNINQFN